jgi:hypothetical protein
MTAIKVEDRAGNVGVTIDGHEFALPRERAAELAAKLQAHLDSVAGDRGTSPVGRPNVGG